MSRTVHHPRVPSDVLPRRPEARRNLDAILDAAVAVLARDPAANMAAVARASGLSRQTVYAHFASRELLVEAVVARAMERAVREIDSVRPEEGPAREALARLLEVSWHTVATHGSLLEAAHATLPAASYRALHAPVMERLERLIGRGRRDGTFAADVPPGWLLATFLALVHAAGREVGDGRLDAGAAAAALRATVPRALGAGASSRPARSRG